MAEVLAEGNPRGFDIVFGNPPYIQLQKRLPDGRHLSDLYSDFSYATLDRRGDIYTLFYERGIQLLHNGGILGFISSNKWLRAGYGEALREFFNKHRLLELIDLGPEVFQSATVDTCIVLLQKEEERNAFAGPKGEGAEQPPIGFSATARELREGAHLADLRGQRALPMPHLQATSGPWFIGSSDEVALKEKIERIGKPLKEWDVKILYGIKTGLNEAFIIPTEKRNEILANCQSEEERKRTEALIKPILRGRDIDRYTYHWAGLWVIVIPAGWTEEQMKKERKKQGRKKKQNNLFVPWEWMDTKFPSLMQHLRQFEEEAQCRQDQGDYWWELRKCAYYPEFEKEKVVWQELSQGAQFALDQEGKFFVNNTAYILVGEHLDYLLGYLNSKLNVFVYKNWLSTKIGAHGIRWLHQHVREIPSPHPTKDRRVAQLISKIKLKVRKITKQKQQGADTSVLEQQIDELVYQLYDLTPKERAIIERQYGHSE